MNNPELQRAWQIIENTGTISSSPEKQEPEKQPSYAI